MIELKKCPFCGSEATLVRKSSSYTANPTTIMDKWVVECDNTNCDAYTAGSSKIYQNEEGEIIVDANGAEIAIAKWNMREGNNEVSTGN
jgi:hypothetical protein